MTSLLDSSEVEYLNKSARRKVRLLDILGKHTRDEDMLSSDKGFIEAAIERWRKHLQAEIVDVNE